MNTILVINLTQLLKEFILDTLGLFFLFPNDRNEQG